MSYGFQHGTTYKIQSVFDGSVLDVWGKSNKPGTKIITWTYEGAKNQHWTVNLEGNGFRLQSMLSDSAMVADQDMTKKALCLWNYKGSLNQQFYAEPCNNGAYLIRCHANDCAIRNMGIGQQIQMVLADPNDISQQWRSQPI